MIKARQLNAQQQAVDITLELLRHRTSVQPQAMRFSRYNDREFRAPQSKTVQPLHARHVPILMLLHELKSMQL